jgi:Skp family chaperone for outer membrane proteins
MAQSNNNIYFIDIDFVMNNSLAGKSIIKELDKINKSSQNEFKKIEKNLIDEEKKIILKKNILSEQEYLKEAELFKKKVDDYNLSRNKKINDISKMKNNSQKKLIETLTPILTEYAQKNSISYIIPKQSIIVGKSELDLTKTIIEILNSKIKKIKLQ